MPVMTITHPQQREEHLPFRETFCIIQDLNDELYWYADRNAPQRGGTYQIWIQTASTDPTIHAILPEWQLILDGVPIVSGFYQNVPIAGKMVELHYLDYIFAVSFTSD